MSERSEDMACGNEHDAMVGSEAHATSGLFKTTHAFKMFLVKAIIVILVSALIATTALTMSFKKECQNEGFDKAHFDSFADKVLDTFLNIANERMTSAGSLVVAIVAHGVDHFRTWPFVALSSFQQRSATTKRLSGAISIKTHPIVWEDQRLAWENYTKYDGDIQWYYEGRAYQRDLGLDDIDRQAQVTSANPNLDTSKGIASHIFTFSESDKLKAVISPKERYYLPVWQTSPVSNRTVVNEDFASVSNGITSCLDRDAVVFEGMRYAAPGTIESSNPETADLAWLLTMSNDGKPTRYEGDIFSTVFFPLYNNFALDRSTVGVMSIKILWSRYFRDIFPERVRGMLVVLDNGCDEPFTYMINGGDVIPMGHGDLHDTKYDDYERKASFRGITSIPDGTKFGVLFYQGRCPYSVRVYPSDEFES